MFRSMVEIKSTEPLPNWDRFDYVACVCFTGYKDRQEGLSQELARIGLLERAHFFWDFPNPYTGLLAKHSCRDLYHQQMFPIGHNNYRAIKTAYELGYSSILVLEDDVRFLRDLSLLAKTIRALPDGYEIAMLDKNFPPSIWREHQIANPKAATEEAKTITWQRFRKFHSSGCYALSREGMGKFIRAYERDSAHHRLKNNDQYFNHHVFARNKMFAAYPNVAIQGLVGTAGCSSPLEEYWMMNEYQGGFQSMYNLECPCITKDNFLTMLYRAADRDVQAQATETNLRGAHIYCALPDDVTKGIKSVLPSCIFSDKMRGIHYGATIIWGNGKIKSNLNALQLAYRDNCPVLLCEDGFIRSFTTWVDKDSPPSHRLGYSYIIDTSAYYFDATRVSIIEKVLNDKNFKVSPEQCAEARRLIDKIVSAKISKYNHQPIYAPTVGREGARKVLVVDQSYGDFSISRGLANDQTFIRMLERAKRENPDADILVKTHPDTMAGKKAGKKGYFQDIRESGNVYKITFPINPYSLMEICDKVYVCSSGMGMEALMAGKEVHVFGMPFYAGWGLTIDDQHLERRTNKRTLEELFYIFYCMYTHWVNPNKGEKTSLDNVIDSMVSMRATLGGDAPHQSHSLPTRKILPIPVPAIRGRSARAPRFRQRLA